MFTGFVAIFIFPTVKDGIIAYFHLKVQNLHKILLLSGSSFLCYNHKVIYSSILFCVKCLQIRKDFYIYVDCR